MQKMSIGLSFVALAGLAQAQANSWNYAEQEKLLAISPYHSAGDESGRFVAVSGEWAVVGAYADDPSGTNSGAAFVFRRSGLGWSYHARLLPAAPHQAADYFGWGVDIDGDTLVVGAHGSNQAATDAGAATVFVRNGTSWQFQQTLTASNAAANDYFGVSVAVEGDLIVCGAYREDPAGITNAGSAYVFGRNDNGTPGDPTDDSWCEIDNIAATGGAGDDEFGWTVAVNDAPGVADDRVAVGAPQSDQPGASAGSAYVFARTDPNNTPSVACDDVWAQESATLLNQVPVGGDLFGYSVGVEADTLVVSANNDAHPNGTQLCGSISIFDRQAGPLWTLNTQLFASNFAASDVLGHDVAIEGGTIVTGAHGDQVYSPSNDGSAYVFRRNAANVWTQRLNLVPSDVTQEDQFGIGVDIDGETIIVGSFFDDPAGTDSGSAYVFTHRFESYTTFCPGDGSSAPCPCSNNSNPLATRGCRNSQGLGAQLRAGGSTDRTANDLELYAANIPGGNACVLFAGASSNAGINFFAGLKCIPPPTVRLGLTASSATGHASWGPGFANPPWSLGETWYFQVWYRDPTNTLCTPAKTTNLTNGVQVTF